MKAFQKQAARCYVVYQNSIIRRETKKVFLIRAKPSTKTKALRCLAQWSRKATAIKAMHTKPKKRYLQKATSLQCFRMREMTLRSEGKLKGKHLARMKITETEYQNRKPHQYG